MLVVLTTLVVAAAVDAAPSTMDNTVCSEGFREQCSSCFVDATTSLNPPLQQYVAQQGQQEQSQPPPKTTKNYNCNLPGLQHYGTGGQYEGVTVNYLSFVTSTSSPNFPIRALEFTNCTGGIIQFSEASNVWEDPISDMLGGRTTTTSITTSGTSSAPTTASSTSTNQAAAATSTSGTAAASSSSTVDVIRGSEVYDGYFMSYSHFPEASAYNLLEHFNERIRNSNSRLKYEDLFPKVRKLGEYRSNGKTNIDFLMYDGDFFLPLIRLDLLQQHNLSLPNTWEEVVEYAKYFNNTDLNNDGIPDYGFCHFPRVGAGYWDWWASEVLYSIWATYDQTLGMQEGFFFHEDTMEPRMKTSEGFLKATQIWKELWINGADGIGNNFIDGRCAIGFGPPGIWKSIMLNKDGISRKDSNGTVIWRPTLLSGEYAEPYRFKPFGTTQIFDRINGTLTDCTPELCPKAEPIPAKGHTSDNDKARILPKSPLEGKLINRAPFYWSGGLGTVIRKSSSTLKKDLMWDFFVYTNSPDTSIYDVANYPSWLDSWRYSQLLPGDNFFQAGWTNTAYQEHVAMMQWGLSNEVNGAMNLRIPGAAKYTRDKVGVPMSKYIAGDITLEEFRDQVTSGWEEVTLQRGKLDQLEIYRAALGRDAHSEVDLCRLHRGLVDKRDPSICRKYDPVESTATKLAASITPSVLALCALFVVIVLIRKRKVEDSLWEIDPSELQFGNPPEVLGRGTFGLVVLAEYRGTHVAVKRVIPPRATTTKTCNKGETKRRNRIFGAGDPQEMGLRSTSLMQNCDDEAAAVDRQRKMSSQALKTVTDGTHRTCGTDIESGISAIEKSTKKAAPHHPRFDSGSFWRVSLRQRRPRNTALLRKRNEYALLKANFITEMRRLSKLRHPSITTVMGAVVRHNQEPMLVMECMDHGSLYDILHNNTIPLEGDLLLPILKDIAQGVRFLHFSTPQVIHGDLKAQNVLIDSRFRAKVTDFGLSAKRHVNCNTGWFQNRFKDAYRGMNFSSNRGGCYATGTPFWMAPELLRGESACTDASDVYSFGIILYEVYSRKEPYEGEDAHVVLKEVADCHIQKRPPVPEGCPPSLAAIMTDCLNGDPTFRPNFQEIDRRLNRLDTKNAEPGERPLSMGTKKMLRAHRNEDLLSKIFPEDIAEALRGGRKVRWYHRDLLA